MEPLHYQHWPKDVFKTITLPKTSVYYNLEVTTARYPDKTAISYYGTKYTYAQIKSEVDRLAGYLQQKCGVKKGDRVLLFMQNCPQFVIAYYAVLRADAVLVPSNPMNLTKEMRHYLQDAGVTVALSGAEICHVLEPLMGNDGLNHMIVTNYGDYITAPTDLPIPDSAKAKMPDTGIPGVIKWADALSANCTPGAHTSNYEDLAAIIYTSGTTGEPKGCMHTHESLMPTIVFAKYWQGISCDDIMLSVVPFFHVTGMQVVMNGAIYVGAEVVIMTRWDRELALELMKRHHVTNWTNIPTMVIDLFASPNLQDDSLDSLKYIGGGGAAMPEAVAKRLFELSGLSFVEGYGLTETAAPTHSNHLSRPKLQCLGIPIFNTKALIIDPGSLKALGPNENGEIVVQGPQLFKGYWGRKEATAESFMEIEGEPYFRTGDLGYYDDEGYYFIVDRLKRMINASGFKVWPAEVESFMYEHPDIQEACIISSNDPYRGETVKAVVVLKDGAKQKDEDMAQNIIAWCKERMAAYKYPRLVEFVDELPKTGSGKIQWRVLQEKDQAR